MSSPRIQLERSGPLATVWLDRADKRNALDGSAMRELAASFDEIGADRSIRAVLLRGRGPVFSSGIDHALLAEVLGATAQTPFLHLHHELQDTLHRVARLHQPVIAVLHGACVGLALELALAADLRLATEDCALGLPEIAFGIVPDVGGTTRLVRAVGEPRARDLILTGRLVRGHTAERYGLVHEIAPDLAAVERLALERARLFVGHPPAALGAAKALCQLAAEADAGTSFRIEGIVQQSLLGPDLLARFPAAVAFIKAQLADPA
jgi:enoyl-CoA hydratase/carnithine racemase